MEPLLTFDGYNIMQDAKQSRDLLNDYYRRQGYEIVIPTVISAEKECVEKVTAHKQLRK